MILIKHNRITFFPFLNYVDKDALTLEQAASKRKNSSSPGDGNKGNVIEIKRFSSFCDFSGTEKIPLVSDFMLSPRMTEIL